MNSKSAGVGREVTRLIVYSAIDALNEQLAADQRLNKSPETILLGANGSLDSLAFINLIVLLEEKCYDHCQVVLSLTEDGQNSNDNPFHTVETLADYLDQRISGNISSNNSEVNR